MAAVPAGAPTREASSMRPTGTLAAAGLGTPRWGRVLPVAFITYSLAYLDRSNYSIGIAGGMKEDLAITGGIASLIGALFFLGYFLFQIPGAIYAERRSVKHLIFWSLIAWARWPRSRAC